MLLPVLAFILAVNLIGIFASTRACRSQARAAAQRDAAAARIRATLPPLNKRNADGSLDLNDAGTRANFLAALPSREHLVAQWRAETHKNKRRKLMDRIVACDENARP